ncbi:hypothetical protein Tco_0156618 [Tanacetum coccineum]
MHHSTYSSTSILVFMVLVPSLWAITPIMLWIPTFISSKGSLIPSGSRISTIPGHVANLLAIPTLYSTWSIVVQLAHVAQWKSSSILLPFSHSPKRFPLISALDVPQEC